MAQATTNTRESSVLFSLSELLLLERQRVDEEAATHAAARAAQLEREAARERQHKEQEAQRLREAEEARRAVEFRARTEATRLEALREAERARVLHEATSKTRLAELAVVHEHERKLAQLHKDGSTKRLRWAAAGITCALLLVAAGGASAFHRYVTESEAEKLALARRTLDAQHAGQVRTAQLERELNRMNAERALALANAPRAMPAEPALRPTVVPTPGKVRPVPPVHRDPPPQKPKCDEWDPMCGL
jgi:colicin import membrane protein